MEFLLELGFIGGRNVHGVRIAQGFDHSIDHRLAHLFIIDLLDLGELLDEDVPDVDDRVEDVVARNAVCDRQRQLHQQRGGERHQQRGSKDSFHPHGKAS